MFASNGHTVRGVDINSSLVESIRAGEVGQSEPDLFTRLKEVLEGGQFTASTTPSSADVFVIAVPTPVGPDHSPDLSYVVDACRSCAGKLSKGDLVIVESTIPPGAIRGEITRTLEESGLSAGTDFSLAYCPERVLPGNIVTEFVENDRIIGGIDDTSTAQAVDLYRSFVTGELRETDAETAEMVKLAENTYRDVNIALANNLANLSESVGVNVWNVVEMANLHPRVNIHTPGAGVGGHCIPVDPWFLVAADEESSSLIKLSREINDGQPAIVARLASEAIGDIKDARAAVLGAAYKPNVTDARESPTTDLASRLADRGLTVAVADPHVTSFAPQIVSLEDALRGADIAILVVGHSEYARLEPDHVARLMRSHLILDTTNTLNREAWERSGFAFIRYGDGRSTG
jgi:UDP-N-acetyl-D-mannosaminuronic acid dehydrogenase